MRFQMLSCLLLALCAVASPINSTAELVAVPFGPSSPGLSPAAATVTRPGNFSFTKAGTTTSANTGFKALEALEARQNVPLLVMCGTTDCSGVCSYVYIPEAYNTCYANAYWYYSAYIYSQFGEGFNFGVYIAEPGCENGLQLPTVNTCYNRLLSGGIGLNLDYYFLI
ncbi:hypothetical protein DFH06DRAFT_1142746 [Mycena polygramma]|nr:hypothetical protein DFH06DRAFT_1142746 [Mycena polygramma]